MKRKAVVSICKISLAGLVIAVLGLVTAQTADACPISDTTGSGSVTAPYVKGATFVKTNKTLVSSNTNTQSSAGCTGLHHLDVPNPASTPNTYIIWAAVAPNGYTGVFFGNSATANFAHTYQYSVSCGPCPPGTPIVMSLRGVSSWNQYAAGAGLAKITGSASVTVTGTVQVAPFPGSPFAVGATPATVTANPGVVTATAGSVNNNSCSI